MRTVHEQYAPLLEGTVDLILKCYAAVHYSKLLDSAAQVQVQYNAMFYVCIAAATSKCKIHQFVCTHTHTNIYTHTHTHSYL